VDDCGRTATLSGDVIGLTVITPAAEVMFVSFASVTVTLTELEPWDVAVNAHVEPIAPFTAVPLRYHW